MRWKPQESGCSAALRETQTARSQRCFRESLSSIPTYSAAITSMNMPLAIAVEITDAETTDASPILAENKT